MFLYCLCYIYLKPCEFVYSVSVHITNQQPKVTKSFKNIYLVFIHRYLVQCLFLSIYKLFIAPCIVRDSICQVPNQFKKEHVSSCYIYKHFLIMICNSHELTNKTNHFHYVNNNWSKKIFFDALARKL